MGHLPGIPLLISKTYIPVSLELAVHLTLDVYPWDLTLGYGLINRLQHCHNLLNAFTLEMQGLETHSSYEERMQLLERGCQ